jgi:hypothetical protein
MNNSNKPEADLDSLVPRILKDDLPPEVEARMRRQFLNLERELDKPQSLVEASVWDWMHGLFRKEILAIVSAVLLLLGAVMHLGESQSVLAHSIERLKVVTAVSARLNRVVFMDCTVLNPSAEGGGTSYRVRWRADGEARVDQVTEGGAQTIWMSDESISFAGSGGSPLRSVPLQSMVPGPVWQPALEFRTPALLAKHMGARDGLMQAGERTGAGAGEFQVVGREDRQTFVITVDAETYLPKLLKKYAPESGRARDERDCLLEVKFCWDQPIPDTLFTPGISAGKP